MIGVVGAGAFGTALAVSLAREGRAVTLWARSAKDAGDMQRSRVNARRLPGVDLPAPITVTDLLGDLAGAEAILLALPMQALGGFLQANPLTSPDLVACCKGIDLSTLTAKGSILSTLASKFIASLMYIPET